MKKFLLYLMMCLSQTCVGMNRTFDDEKIYDFLKTREIIPTVSEFSCSMLRDSITLEEAVFGLFSNFVKNFNKKLSEEKGLRKLYSKKQILMINKAYCDYKKKELIDKLCCDLEKIKIEMYSVMKKSKDENVSLFFYSLESIIDIAKEIIF